MEREKSRVLSNGGTESPDGEEESIVSEIIE